MIVPIHNRRETIRSVIYFTYVNGRIFRYESTPALASYRYPPAYGVNMRDFFRLSCLAAILATLLLVHTAIAEEPTQAQRPFRHVSYKAAWKSSRKTGLPMLLYVTMDRCHYCKKMRQELHLEPLISTDINRRFETVSINKSVRPKLVSNLRVRVFPTTFVIAPGGKIVERIEGYVGPEELMVQLRPSKRTAQAQLTPPSAVDAEQRQ